SRNPAVYTAVRSQNSGTPRCLHVLAKNIKPTTQSKEKGRKIKMLTRNVLLPKSSAPAALAFVAALPGFSQALTPLQPDPLRHAGAGRGTDHAPQRGGRSGQPVLCANRLPKCGR